MHSVDSLFSNHICAALTADLDLMDSTGSHIDTSTDAKVDFFRRFVLGIPESHVAFYDKMGCEARMRVWWIMCISVMFQYG